MPEAFADNARVFTVVYGTREGWKKQILQDLQRCGKFIFLPDLLGDKSAAAICRSSFDVYRDSHRANVIDARSAVEEDVTGKICRRHRRGGFSMKSNPNFAGRPPESERR